MTDLDRDEQLLVTSLRDRLAGVHPDLGGITAGAALQGRRIRRRRLAGAGLAGTACAGLVLGGVFLLPGLGADRTATETGVLAEPAPEAAAEATAEPVCPDGSGLTPPPAGGASGADRDRPRALKPPPVRPVCEDTYPDPGPQDLAFTVAVPDGWACEDPADEKLSCRVAGLDPWEAPGATMVQREASHHDEYLGMKGEGYAVSDLHGGYFVSVQPNPRASTADVELLTAALTWDDGAPVF